MFKKKLVKTFTILFQIFCFILSFEHLQRETTMTSMFGRRRQVEEEEAFFGMPGLGDSNYHKKRPRELDFGH